jgi:hypothetical protein
MTDLARWDPDPIEAEIKAICKLGYDAIPSAIQKLAKSTMVEVRKLRELCNRWGIELDVAGIWILFHALHLRRTVRGVLEEHGQALKMPNRRNRKGILLDDTPRMQYFPLLTPHEWQSLAIAASGQIARPPRRSERVYDSRWVTDFL